MLHNPLYDFNGVLDTNPSTGEKEDQNGNNRLDPGNVASVSVTPAPGITDATGHATVSVVYARDYAYWVNAKLEAFANDLKGSTASASVTFSLPGSAADYNDQNVSPPGNPSPFGTSTSCYVDLTVTPVSSSQMALTWQKSAAASYYRVFRNGINVAVPTQPSYFDTGLSSGTLYCYQIRTVDAAGTESSFTGTVCNSTAAVAPSGLTATAISPSQIRLSWTPLAGVTGYRVYRDTGLGLVLRTSVVSTSTVDSGLTPNTLYCYAVSGNNAAGAETPKSGQVCATTQLSAPQTPTGLAATGTEGAPPAIPSAVTLTWNATSGAAVYRFYRDGGATPALSVAAPAVTVVDTGLDIGGLNPKTGYCYTITAASVTGNESPQSTPVCTATGGVVIPAPTGLTSTLLPGPQVRLNWSASIGAVGYRIYRNGVATLLAGAANVTDTTVAGNTGYCYAVSALDGAGNESAKSAQVCISTGAAAPPVPTLQAPTVFAGPPLRIDLTWITSAGAVSYRIYRNGGTFPFLEATGAQTSDTSVVAATNYCYSISAVDASGSESAQSTPLCVSTPP